MELLKFAYEKIFGADTETEGQCAPCQVVCFGNVLLDHTFQLDDPELLQRHNLEPGSKGEMELEEIEKLVTDASNSAKCLVNPGGSALNTTRILKKLGTEAQFFGSVGSDKRAEQLRDVLREQCINARLQTIDDTHTGQCICFIYKDNPTMYANIGASEKFSLEEISRIANNNEQTFLRPIERKQILYIEGFFLTRRTDVCGHLVENYVRSRRRLAVNLSAPYIVQQQSKTLLKLIERAYFVFGNLKEFEALCDVTDCKSVETLGRQLLEQSSGPKIILVTNGASGVRLITNYVGEKEPAGIVLIEDFKAPRVENVVDATGAGDAFVAGFFHNWLQKRSITECVRNAMDVAATVITQLGCNLP